MDTLTLAIICVCYFTGLGIWDYIHFIKQRSAFIKRVSMRIGNPGSQKEVILAYLNDRIYYLILPFLDRLTTKKTAPTGVSLLHDVTLPKILMLNGGVLLLAYNIQKLFDVSWFITVAIFGLAQLVLYNILKNKQVKVRESLEKKLPEILDIMARVYRVHTDLRIAVKEVETHMHDPVVKSVFGQMERLSRFGYTIDEAMEYVAKDIESPDLDFLVSSIKLNIPVGGNLPKLFESTAKMLRERKEASDEIQNLMFQSKISAVISALLVPVIIIVSFTSSEDYQNVLIKNPTGRLVFFFCLIWWLIGVMIIRKNSRIDI